jgi:myosin heavy subunit
VIPGISRTRKKSCCRSFNNHRFQNEAIELERAELRDRFNEYEKKLVEINNELIAVNKTSNLKDLQIDELSRRVMQVEEEEARKTRIVKMGLEEQLDKLRHQNVQDIRGLEEENRRLKEAESKIEQKHKDLTARDQAKERSIMEWERKVSDLEEKVNRLNKQLREQADQIDRLCLEKEDLNRKLGKESAKTARLEQELKEYEDTEESRLKEHIEMKKTAKIHQASNIVTDEITVRDEGFQQRTETGSAPAQDANRGDFERLARKNNALKEKLHNSNQKLVQLVADKVMLLQKVSELGLDLNSLGLKEKPLAELLNQPKQAEQRTKTPLAAFQRDFAQTNPNFMTQGEQFRGAQSPPFNTTWGSQQPVQQRLDERELLAKRMKDIGGTQNLGDTAAKVFGLTTIKEQEPQQHNLLPHPQRRASPCPAHPHGRQEPPLQSNIPRATHLMPLREYTSEVQTLSEDDLQRKIHQLLHQRESFYKV